MALIHGFCQKMEIFHLLFFSKMDKEKVFSKVLERKETFLDYKNIGSRNPQNLHFSKGVSKWFLSKNRDFSIFCIYAKWIKKNCFLNF